MQAGGLCVSLTPENLDDVFTADISGADCVEVRLDYLGEPRQSFDARWDRLPVPVIATCRGRERGGRFGGTIEQEAAILERAVSNGARFVDIDYRHARPFAGADVIASFHDFAGTPEDLDSILEAACASDAQIAKIATQVNSWADNSRILDLLSREWPKPVIVIGMGELGQITRLIGPSRGSYLTYGSVLGAAAPGQISLKEMLDGYRFRRIRPSTKLLGVLGNPVSHSLSPILHNRAFEVSNLDFAYLKFQASDLRDFFASVKTIGIQGFSVTIPYKVAAIPFLNGQTMEALEAGAVNTVYRREGKWFGDNTDVHGVAAALSSVSFDPAGKRVLILGTGGASKAAQVAVKKASQIKVLPRTQLGEAARFECDLLINATPVGMWPDVDASPVSGPIHAEVVFDMVYNPPVTRLLSLAAAQGKTVIQGTSMFREQAARQFEIWTGQQAPAEIYEHQSFSL